MKLIRSGYIAMCGHRLTAGVPEGHPCRREHGHNYRITVTIEAPVNPDTGMVLEYAQLDRLVEDVLRHIDHRHLNTCWGDFIAEDAVVHAPDFARRVEKNPTVENLVTWFKEELLARFRKTVQVDRVWVRIEEDDRSAVEI